MNTLTEQTTGAVARLTAGVEAARTAAEREAAAKMKLAQAFDAKAAATPGGIPLPKFLHSYARDLYGVNGILSYDDQTSEQILALTESFPALAAGLHRARQGTSYKLAAAAVNDQPEAFTAAADGHHITMDGGIEYGYRVKVEWFTELASGLIVEVKAEVRQIHGITPFFQCRTTQDHYEGRVIETDSAHFPLPVEGPALREVTYSRGSRKSYRMRLFWGDNVLAHVKRWADECFARGVASRRAYEADKAAGLPAEPLESGSYESRSLKVGTKAQADCLETDEARKDWALAKKHWKDYAADHGIPFDHKSYADHYTWACNWLLRHGLYIDPNGPSKDGSGYKYGTAWL